MDNQERYKAMFYCSNKCRTFEHCTGCQYDYTTSNCKAYFLYDLYNIIDTKTLELNNKKDVINRIYFRYVRAQRTDIEYSFQYTIKELFLDNRYKITKKPDYDKLIESCGKES